MTENIANQTEAIYKSYIGGWKNTTTGGVEISREIASIDRYAGLSSKSLPGGNPGGNIVGASIYYPQFTFANTGGNPQWTPPDQDRGRYHQRLRNQHLQL